MRGIGSGIHYPIPLHLQRAYGFLGYASGNFPIAERVASEIVSLPIYPQLTEEQQTQVVSEVLRFLQEEVVTGDVSPYPVQSEPNEQIA